jgi:hypothetical protein
MREAWRTNFRAHGEKRFPGTGALHWARPRAKCGRHPANMDQHHPMIVVDPENPRGIVWLPSYPKSGNTWVRAFIYALLRVQAGDPPAAIDINEMNRFQRSELDPSIYARHLPGPIMSVDRALVAAARPRVHEDIAREARGLVLIKTHNARGTDHGHPLVNTRVSTGAIYVIRNPLDVAISFAKFQGVSIDRAITDMATSSFGTNLSPTTLHTIFGTWSEHVESWTGREDPAVHVTRYEDMLERPRETFAALTRHLRMAPTVEEIDAAIDLSSFDRLRAAEQRGGFRERPDTAQLFFRAGRAGQWRDQLTRAQVDRIVRRHGTQMARFGYLP